MDELSILEESIQDKIAETKAQMDRTMLRAETDRLWPIIETLKWVQNIGGKPDQSKEHLLTITTA